MRNPVRKYKLKEISEKAVIQAILDLQAEGKATELLGWTTAWDIDEKLGHTNWPLKVLKLKRKKMVAKGLIHGCSCGCRGDFTVTEKGLALATKPNST